MSPLGRAASLTESLPYEATFDRHDAQRRPSPTTAFSSAAFCRSTRLENRDHNNGYYTGNRWHAGTPSTTMMRPSRLSRRLARLAPGRALAVLLSYATIRWFDYRSHRLPPPRRRLSLCARRYWQNPARGGGHWF